MVICRARGMIVHENKMLLMRLPNNDFYCLPGGKVESYETVKGGLDREMCEELGVEVKGATLVAMQNFFGGGKQANIDFIYRIHNAEDFVNLDSLQNGSHSFERDSLERIDLDDASKDIKPNFLLQKAKKILTDGLDAHRISMYHVD